MLAATKHNEVDLQLLAGRCFKANDRFGLARRSQLR